MLRTCMYKMASSLASTWAWPSCSVRRGISTIVSRRIVQCDWSSTFGELIVKIDLQFSDALVERVQVLYFKC